MGHLFVMKHGTNQFWQIILKLPDTLQAIRGATGLLPEYLGRRPHQGQPRFVILNMPACARLTFFGWRWSFGICVLNVFDQRRLIACYGCIAVKANTTTASLLLARQAQGDGLLRSGLLKPRGMFSNLMQSVRTAVALQNQPFTDVLTRHIRQKAYYAC
ncbi:MAG: hypothetical protein R3B94_13415 [Hyphomonas sp.]